jgi:hypothetical protein
LYFLIPGARAKTPELIEEFEDHVLEPETGPHDPPEPDEHGRHKSLAALKHIDPSAVLARLSGPIAQSTEAIISGIRSHYAVPEGEQDPGVESGEYRTRLKRKAAAMSRSQYEVYSFTTKHDLSEAATDELLEMLSNVSTSLGPCIVESVIMSNTV